MLVVVLVVMGEDLVAYVLVVGVSVGLVGVERNVVRKIMYSLVVVLVVFVGKNQYF